MGLAQGLRFLGSCRLNLSDSSFGAVSAAQAEQLARDCKSSGIELDALFLRAPFALPASAMESMKAACPKARCLALGGEVSEETFEGILEQIGQNDDELAEALCPTAGEATVVTRVPPPKSFPSIPLLCFCSDDGAGTTPTVFC